MNETQNTQLDPNALALTKAIALQENGGQVPTDKSYLNQGKTGERGLYQFRKETWNNYAKQVLGNPNADPTPENQNKVAYTKVKQWLDKGYKPEQVASMWNAGEGAPDAYSKGLSGATTTGVKYDVRKYGDNVLNYYHQNLKTENTKEEPSSLLGKIIDFAFPIVSDVSNLAQGKSKKTGLQMLGDLGLSALWFLPGVGEIAGGAIKGAGLLGNVGSRIAGEAIGGAAMGYGADVASKLAEGKTSAGEVLTPGFGTATGGVLGGALGKIGAKYSESGILKGIGEGNNSAIGQFKKGTQELSESFAKGQDQGALLAHKGINIKSMINPETVAYETADAAAKVRADSGKLSEVLGEALQKVPGTSTVTELQAEIENKIGSFYKDKVTAREAKNIVANEFDKIRNEYGEMLSASDINAIKQRAWELSKFDMQTPNLTRKVYRNIGNTLKTTVEDLADQAGLNGVSDMNELIGQHLDVADSLDRINGNKAKGGRLGDIMQRTAMMPVGAVFGGMGGGPLGSFMGALAMGPVSDKISTLTRKIMSSPIKTSILKNMIKEDPEIVQKMIQYAQKTPHGLEVLDANLKLMGVNLFEKPLKGVPLITPQTRSAGMLPQLLTGAATRAVQTGQ